MRILLTAFACFPGSGSEPNIGWNMSIEIARQHEVWALTAPANQRFIASGLSTLDPSVASRLRFVYVKPQENLANLGRHYAYYMAWQMMAYSKAKELHHQVGFDIVWHATYVSPWTSAFVAYLGVPFIWNAGTVDYTPWAFLTQMSLKGSLAEMKRNMILATWARMNILTIGKRASLIFTSSTPERWPSGLPVVRMPLGGLDIEDISALMKVKSVERSRSLRIISVGRLLGLKGLALGMRAVARLCQSVKGVEWWIVGEGPEERYLKRLSHRLGCNQAVKFLGKVPRARVFELLASADVLLHPSLHEQFAYVVLEAMAAGKPVICLDVAGPSVLMEQEYGFKIKVESPERVVANLFEALYRLACEPNLGKVMGDAARERAINRWNWQAVGRSLLCEMERALEKKP